MCIRASLGARGSLIMKAYRDQASMDFEEREESLLKKNADLAAELAVMKDYLKKSPPLWVRPFNNIKTDPDNRVAAFWLGAVFLIILVFVHNAIFWASYSYQFHWLNGYLYFILSTVVSLFLASVWFSYVQNVWRYKEARNNSQKFPHFDALPSDYQIGIRADSNYPFVLYKGGKIVTSDDGYRKTSYVSDSMVGLIEKARKLSEKEE
jgi:hypothetical protein